MYLVLIVVVGLFLIYLAFAAVHLVIIGTGLFFLRQARRAVAAESARWNKVLRKRRGVELYAP